jgi:hypothetical protein
MTEDYLHLLADQWQNGMLFLRASNQGSTHPDMSAVNMFLRYIMQGTKATKLRMKLCMSSMKPSGWVL